MAEQKINRNYLIIGGLALATVLALVTIQVFDLGNNSPSPEDSQLEEELGQEILELESSILELELVYQEKDRELDQMLELVEQKNDRLQAMEQRLDELEREGRLDKATIARLRKEIERAKRLTESQQKINILVREQNTMTRVLDSVKQTLFKRDSSLRIAEARLMDCGGDATTERGLENLEPLFWAEDIRVYNVVNANREKKEEIERDIDQEKVGSLEICLNLKGNAAVQQLGGMIYMIIRSPGNKALINYQGGSRSVVLQGKDVAVSAVVNLTETNSSTADVCFDFTPDGQLPWGKNNIEFYYQDQRLSGGKSIVVY